MFSADHVKDPSEPRIFHHARLSWTLLWAICASVEFWGRSVKIKLTGIALKQPLNEYHPKSAPRSADDDLQNSFKACTASEWSPTLKWSPNRPGNDSDPEMIPTFLFVDPEMIPKELGNGD